MKTQNKSVPKVVYFLFVLTLIFSSTAFSKTINDAQLELVTSYDKTNTSLYDYKADKVLLIAFLPSVSSINEYANVMNSAFDTYFAEGLSLRGVMDDPYDKVRVLVVSYEDAAILQDYAYKMNLDFAMVNDKDFSLSNNFSVTPFGNENASAKVFIVDKNNEISYTEETFRGEGEKLKAIQGKIYDLLGVEQTMTEQRYTAPISGDQARDFDFYYAELTGTGGLSAVLHSELSSLKGKNVLLGFYPAPFSFSCGGEISSYTGLVTDYGFAPNSAGQESFKDLEVLMVSDQNTSIMQKWAEQMNFGSIKLISDLDAGISSKYNSYEFEYGYNRRTVFLIDKEGVIKYIDWDYHVSDEDFNLLKEEIKKLD